MFVFVRRRSSAVLEGLLFAVVLTMLAGLTGLTSISEMRPANDPSMGQASQREQVLEGLLTIKATAPQADGTHWSATLSTGGRDVSVRISHEDSHRVELMGAKVDVQGTWAGDNTFVANGIDPVDPNAVPWAEKAEVTSTALLVPKGKPKTLEGVMTFRHGDDFVGNRRTATHYFLATNTGDTELKFSRAPSANLAGARVRVTGTPNGTQLNVADGGTTQLAATTSTGTTSTGVKRLAVVLVNFSNDTSQPYTPEFAAGVAFNNTDSVAAYYAEASWRQVTMSGDVFGWYTIPNTNANCAYSTWSTAANAAAASAGVDLSTYTNVVYAFPTTTCGWSGLANMPGKTAWLNGPMGMSLRVMAHELGHNFGTHHASQLNCIEGGVRVSLSATASNCTSGEYGDPFSVMGMATRYQHTNFAKGNLNWLSPANTQTVVSSGDYLVAPAEVQSSTGVSSLRLQRTTSTWFTLEFRQHYGSYFETFASTAPVVTGVTIRLTSAYSTLLQSQLIDATPGSSSFDDAPLAPGLTFTDPLTNVSITTLGTSSAGALVRVSFESGSTPTPTSTPTTEPTQTPAPTATPSPSPTPTASPGPTASPTPYDTQPPTAPDDLTATVGKSRRITVTWAASIDNIGVNGYRVYRDGTLVATLTKMRWNDSLAFAGGTRLYAVVAFDAAGNVSSESTATLP
jgi:hypothetical protein